MGKEEKIRKRIEKRLSKIENNKLREAFKQELLLDEFDDILFRINHKHEDLVDNAVEIAKKIKILEGWPDNKQKFWDLEATNWKFRVPVNVKEFISSELSKTAGERNLDIGAGSTSYVNDSVCLDVSYEMLGWNESNNKVQASGEYLPFKKDSFDSVTMVFTANYVDDLNKLIREVYKVLKKTGKMVCVLSDIPIHKMHRLIENKGFNVDALLYSLTRAGFRAKKELKKTGNTPLVFVEAEK